ncbi:flippase [Pseudoalteromonas sp. Z9A5]|uniref:flippase n=1 Tax=Pseudoalteromonas sp. Z9A5 TaxID=2686355 RepID=UPI001407FA3B|nr:flippase [Pseudoalteromonas sp. Z9A5]
MSKKDNIVKVFWYGLENFTTIAFGLLSVVLVARLFGPESLGKLSYIQAISALTVFITVLGLDHIVVRDLSRKPTDVDYISTVFITQFVAWCIQCLVIYGGIWFVSDGIIEADLFVIFIWVSISVYFSRATVVKLYFQSVNQPKKIGLAALKSRLIALMYLFLALACNFSYEYVVAFIPIQAVLQFLFLFFDYKKNQKIKVSFSFSIIKKVLLEARPLLIAAAIYPLFIQADIVLISSMMSQADAGIYSAAGKVIMQFAFVGTIITMTFYLPLSKKVDTQSDDLDLFFSGLIKILFVFGLVSAISVGFFSDLIIKLLFGNEFIDAAPILKILIWKIVVIYIAAVFSRMLVLMNLAKFELIKSIVAASFSLSMNYFLIPIYGLYSAAIISVLSFFIADLFFYAVFKKTRYLFFTAIKAMFDVFIHPIKSYENINYVISSKN